MTGNLNINKKFIGQIYKFVEDFKNVKVNEINNLLPEVCSLINNCLNVPQKKVETKTIMTNAVEYFQENYKNKIDVDNFSRKNGSSPANFRRQFKKHFGISPHQYLISIRMEKAVEMLCDFNFSIKDIANELGYSSQYEFSNYFKKFYQLSPKKYREKYLEKV